MPTVPTATLCSELGCKNNKSRYSSKCLDHGGKDTIRGKANRKEFNAMYQKRFWDSLRRIRISQNPLCQRCMVTGKVASATVVDHVFPWAKLDQQAFYKNHFQCLCRDCHTTKTLFEQKGIILQYIHGHEEKLSIHDYPYEILKSSE
jgi:5-methylcytosine-specific restriction protein A